EVAKSKNMDKFFHEGRYKITQGMNNRDLVNMIKAGNQSEDTFRIIDFGDVYQMVGRVTRKTERDSMQFITELNKIAVNKGYNNAEDLKKYFFADTYNFFWTVTPQEFFKKFEDQYNDFWTENRLQKEKELGLSREQIYALASIVYKESGGKTDEQKTIAGLYINRYRKGMKLQSDPTVIYAINKENNFTQTIKRVLYKHLKYPSPYNTYANAGIPPGPICIVDKNSVDAVLNAEKNDYIFMAADPDRFGYHRFTASDAEHSKNARDYQNWLNKKNIK
ncbi:MAG: endolytic transglycosylase MltG, partial [Bergeyella zoohelcum]|nr:endolytic transglycosylase MltG [Bergeyella zoohelcum]